MLKYALFEHYLSMTMWLYGTCTVMFLITLSQGIIDEHIVLFFINVLLTLTSTLSCLKVYRCIKRDRLVSAVKAL